MQLTSQLAYLLGALRDGSVSKFKDWKGKIHHSIVFYSGSIGWLKVIQQKIKEVFDIETKISQYTYTTPFIRIYSKKLAEIFHKEFQHPLKSQISWETPILIKKCRNEDFLINYIAGFWDAEGGIDKQNKQVKFYLSWDGERCPPLNDIKKMLENLGIRSGRVCGYPNPHGKFPRFVLRVSRHSTREFLEKIPVQHPEKKRKLQSVCRAYNHRTTYSLRV